MGGAMGESDTEGNAVLTLLDPLAAHQLQTQRPVQQRLSGEVERIEALGLWKVRQPNVTLYVAALLQFAQAQQIARIIGTILRQFRGDFFVLAGECGKTALTAGA